MTDLERDYKAYGKGVLTRDEMFLILLRHAEEHDWHDVVDGFSKEERDEFQSWARDLVTGHKTLFISSGYHGPTEEERGPLRQRFEERGWLKKRAASSRQPQSRAAPDQPEADG